jgi:hypothetical protein
VEWRNSAKEAGGSAEVLFVNCTNEKGLFRFSPVGGEYVYSNVWAAPRMQPDLKKSRDSLTLGVGRCSPIAG